MKEKLVIFGRKMCFGCQELKGLLTAAHIPHEYHSLDTPDVDYDSGDSHSLAVWAKARGAQVQAASYHGILNNPQLPIVLKVRGDPYEETDAFERINVLTPEGQIDLSQLQIGDHKQREIQL